MKKVFLLVVFLLGTVMYGQEVIITDWDNNSVEEYVKYDNNGNKVEQGHLVDGQYHGTIISYHPNGEVRAIAKFQNGKRDGLWKYFNIEGLITHEVVYEDNRRVRTSVTHHHN